MSLPRPSLISLIRVLRARWSPSLEQLSQVPSQYVGFSQVGASEEVVIAPSTVQVTPIRLKELRSEGTKEGESVLRVAIEGGGCSGFQYIFSLDKQEKGDRVFERDGVKVVCDDISFDFLKGATVEFSEDLIKSAFQVTNNPNMESSCGCGSSFVAKME